MMRRMPNWLLAVIVGCVISLATIPDRMRDFTNPDNPTIDRFIVQDFGLTGALVYHFVVAAIAWMVISWIVLAIIRRRPKPKPPAESP